MITGEEYLKLVFGVFVLIYSINSLIKLVRERKGYFVGKAVEMPTVESADKIPVALNVETKRQVALSLLQFPVILVSFLLALIFSDFAVKGPFMWAGLLVSAAYLFYAVWIAKSTFTLGGKFEFPVWVRVIGIIRNVVSIPYMAYWLWEMIIKRFVA